MVKIVLLTTLIFFLPSFILGMVSPVVVRLSLSNLATSGNTVGKIYAFSTLGSIVGTFLTGFGLILAFGTREIVLGVGASARDHGSTARQSLARATPGEGCRQHRRAPSCCSA